jgi:hypothetical protein
VTQIWSEKVEENFNYILKAKGELKNVIFRGNSITS